MISVVGSMVLRNAAIPSSERLYFLLLLLLFIYLLFYAPNFGLLPFSCLPTLPFLFFYAFQAHGNLFRLAFLVKLFVLFHSFHVHMRLRLLDPFDA